MNKKKH